MKKVFGVVLGSMKWLWRLLFVAVFVFSLAFNVIAVLGGALFNTVSAAVESLTGARTLVASHADEVADLNADLVAERRVQRELRGDVADLSADLTVARTTNRELRDQVTELGEEVATSRVALRQSRNELLDLTDNLAAERLARRQLQDDFAAGLVEFKGRKIALKEAVGETADTVSSRAAKSATREIGAMTGEAIPYVGTAVIVGVTALEIADLCQTIRDMNALKQAFNREEAPSEEELTVCSMVVPSRAEIWEAAAASPGKAWDYASEAVPSLEDIQSIEMPSLASMGALWQGLKDRGSEAWTGTAEQSGKIWRWMTE